jgi:hypothetical protein
MINKLSAEQIQENLEKFYSTIDKYISGDRKDQLLDMYKDLEENLVIAPASTKKDYHNAFYGGFVDHTLRVVEYAIIFDKVWDKFGQKKDYSLENLVFSAINHDLGKLGYKDAPHYVPNDSDWHVKQGFYFKYNPQLTHMRIADRSLYMLQKYGIFVEENEYLAVKLHDGMYEEGNVPYYKASNPEFSIKTNLVHVLHQADFTASKLEYQNK